MGMESTLEGKKIAILATDGVERVELEGPRDALINAGAEIEVLSLEAGEFRSFDHLEPASVLVADVAVADADATDYDGLVIPGGTLNSDLLRGDDEAVAFVAAVAEQKKPIGAICHGPWVLLEAGLVDGRNVTSFPSLKTDLKNAGANWSDEQVVVDQGMVTSRKPEDIPAFSDKLIEEFAEGPHEHAPQPSAGA